MIGAYEMELGPQVANVVQHVPSCRIGVIYIYSAGFMIKIGQKLHECQRVSAGPVAHHIYDGSQILRQSLSAIFACTVKHGRLAATVRFRSSSANFLK
jgi:hypothetical protein